MQSEADNPLESSWKSEFLQFRDVALPSAFSNLCESIPYMLMIVFVGHMANQGKSSEQVEKEVDAVSLGLAYFNVTCLSLGYGALSGTRTLFSQAIGAKKDHLCAIYFQRAFMVSLLVFIPCAILQIFADKVLIALGQPAEVAELSQTFVTALIPTYFAWVWYALCVRILQCYSKAYILLVSSFTLAVACPSILFLFFKYSSFGYMSSAYACLVFLWVPLFSLVPYMIYKLDLGYLFKPRSIWEIFEKDGMLDYLKLSLGGALQMCLEWWVLEAVSILAGLLKRPLIMIGASYSLLNFESIIVMVWVAISAFNSVRVGYFIGAKDVDSAKKACLLGNGLAFCLGCLISISILIFRRDISKLYAEDESIASLTYDLLIVMVFLIPFDALNCSLGGVMIGLGLQKQAAIAQLIGYYVLGIPFSAIMAFVNPFHLSPDLGIYWLWIGVAIAMFSAFCMQLFLILRYDWNRAVEACQKRLHDSSIAD
jgi:MATE family multidrug resistance protein